MSTASAETFPSRPASSAVWERALERHREDTAIDITSDAIAPELGSICNHDTLLLFAKERRGACNMDTHWDTRTSDTLRPILVDLELLLGIVTGTAPSVAKKDIAYKAIISVIEQVSHVPDELCSTSSTTGVEECCVQYAATIVVLMGLALARKDILMKDDSVRMLLEELRLQVDDLRWKIGPSEVQCQRAWGEIQDAEKQAHLDLHNLDAIDTISDLILRLNAYWCQTKVRSKDQTRLLAAARSMLDPHTVSLREMDKNVHVTAIGRNRMYGIVVDVFSRLTTILQRVSSHSPTEEVISASVLSCRILLEMTEVILLSVGVIKGRKVWFSIKLWTGIEKSVLLSPMESISMQLWKDAITMYTATTGKDIISVEMLQGIDSVDGLRSMLDTEAHSFTHEKERYGAIHKVFEPISKCITQILDVVSDAVESHLSHSKVIFGAIGLLFKAARVVGATYNTVLKLLTTLSDFLGRLELYAKQECSAALKMILTQILCQLLGLETKVIAVGRISAFGKAIVGLHDTEVHDALAKLDQLIDSEGRLVEATTLRIVSDTGEALRVVDIKVTEVLQGVGRVQTGVQEVFTSVGQVQEHVMVVRSILEQQHNTVAAKEAKLCGVDITPAPLPTKQAICIGRDENIDAFKALLLQRSHVLILGTGGVGKTTIALELLHHPEVASAFSTRYFVSCDAVLGLEAFRLRVADSLGVSPEMRGQQLLSGILRTLRARPSVLCIDNFETIWEPPQSRKDVEEDLAQLAGVDDVVLIVTMRGVERPGGIAWAPTTSLRPLSVDDGLTVFAKVSGAPVDEYGEELVRATDGLPLAISILAHLTQPEMETTESLWKRWKKAGPAVASRDDGANERQFNLGTSIDLSLSSPRMLSDPSALTVLAIIKELPDGLPQSPYLLDEFQKFLPADVNLQRSLQTLNRVALVHIDKRSGENGRYLLLAPTREYCVRLSTLRLPDDTTHAYRTFYAALITSFRYGETDARAHAIVRPELLNVSSILTEWLKVSHPDAGVICAVLSHADWSQYIGFPTSTLLRQVMKHPIDDKELLAKCHQCLGDVLYYTNELQEAEQNWDMALIGHVTAGKLAEAAHVHHSLEQLYTRTDRLDKAEDELTSALRLHQEVQDSLWEAHDYQALASVYRRRSQLDKAEDALMSALRLHKEVEDSNSEANDRQELGELYIRTGRPDKAEDELTSALRLHKGVHSSLGEANDLRALGEVYQRTGRLYEAEAALTSALRLHREVQSSLSEAHDYHRLGTLYLRTGRLSKAEAALRSALRLHKGAQDSLGEAYDYHALGELHRHAGQLDKAEDALMSALRLHKEVQDPLGEANDHGDLGTLYMHAGRLDKAEAALMSALRLHKEVQSALGEAHDHRALGALYHSTGRSVEAEAEFNASLRLHREVQSTVGVADDHHALGELYRHTGRPDKAEVSLTLALRLHKEVQDPLGEAHDHQQLGDLYLCTDRLDKSEDELTSALRLHKEVQDPLGEANDYQRLGVLYSRTGRPVDAMTSLQDALHLFEQIGNNLGRAHVLQLLGELYLHSNQFQEAEAAFSQVFGLHEEIQDYIDAQNDLKYLVKLYFSLGREDDAAGALQSSSNTFGSVYIRMGRLDEAEAPLREALQLHQGLEGVDEKIARDRALLDLLRYPVEMPPFDGIGNAQQCYQTVFECHLDEKESRDTFTSINGIADTTNTVASPGGAGTQLVSSAVASGLHTVEQMTTNNKHVNCIPSAFVEGNTDPQNVIDQEPVLADSADGHVLAESGLGSSSGSQSIQSCSSAQVRDQVIQTTESQVLATGPSAGKIVRRSNRNRERTEATSSMTPIHSDHPLKRARIGNTPTNKSKTAAVVVSKPKPIAMADGRFACPHCPAQQFERYHDCRRHIDMSKRCLGWNGTLYPCRRCEKEYTRPDAAKRHMDDKPNCGQKGGRKKGGKKENKPKGD
ncbi:predicted protein [Postia placenta Mad-698-R]|nr:predicted protein [Postia placenta Mad-698-R]